MVKIKNLSYSWPSSHTADGLLTNDGSGTLTWATIGSAGITPDSLDFSEFVNSMTVDETTTVNLYNGSADVDLRYYNSDSSDELLFLDGSTGNVGIGTTGPGYPLELMKDQGVTSGERGLAWFRRTSSGDAGIMIGYRANGSSATGGSVRSANALPLFLGTSGANEAVTIDNAGNVGIGTTGPEAKLEVSGGNILLDNNQTIQFKNSTGDIRNGIQYDSSNNLIVGNLAVSSLILKESSDNDLVISNGNVSIGTTTTGGKLNVAGDIRFIGDNYSLDSLYNNINIHADSNANGAGIIHFKTSGTEDMTINT
ncbi:MAG: hypothetical protein ACTSPB_26895, partial [Candidatus Thorarchaeota archaeon]